MKFPFVAVVVFAVTLGLGGIWRKRAAPEASSAMDQGEAGRRGVHEKPGESLLAEVRALLRAGDLEGAKKRLADAAAHDPRAFFVVLSHLAHIDGLDDLVKQAAAALEWNEPDILRMLNGVPVPAWRDMAWEADAGARVGKLPDEEVYDVAICARRNMWVAGIETLLNDAAGKRPAAFMEMLNRKGGTSIREAFCEILMKVHPEMAGDLFRSIPDGSPGANYDRAYYLQAQMRGQPTAANLTATMSEAGPSAMMTVNQLVYSGYSIAPVEEREKIRQLIEEQPDATRRAMLGGALFGGDVATPFGEFNELLGMSESGLQQREALERWMKKQPDMDPAERGWIDQLPTEKLKAKANEILDAKMAAVKKE